MPVLKEMLEIHERAYRTTMQLMMDSVKDDIISLKQSVDEMKQSLHYSQKDIDDVKTKIEKIADLMHSGGSISITDHFQQKRDQYYAKYRTKRREPVYQSRISVEMRSGQCN